MRQQVVALWRAYGRHGIAAGTGLVLLATGARAERVAVQFPEGSAHAFLQVSGTDGKVIAGGDLVEIARDDEVRVRLIFRFRDGSVDDERAVYSQRGHFRLLSDRHVQRGPSFEHATDVALDMATGTVTTRTEESGHEVAETVHMDLPTDLANGMLLMMLKNVSPSGPATMVSYLAATPKPRLIHLRIEPAAKQGFVVGGVRHEAVRFTVTPEIGGVEGMVAPMLGMKPKPTEVWMSGGDVPAFARLEGPTFLGGPSWTVEMAKPSWPGLAREIAAKAAEGKVVR